MFESVELEERRKAVESASACTYVVSIRDGEIKSSTTSTRRTRRRSTRRSRKVSATTRGVLRGAPRRLAQAGRGARLCARTRLTVPCASFAVAVAQLVEPRVVVPVVAGASPVRHPPLNRLPKPVFGLRVVRRKRALRRARRAAETHARSVEVSADGFARISVDNLSLPTSWKRAPRCRVASRR